MNKNIRRTIVIAAGVSGAWALGSAVASADELPAHSVSVPDKPAEAVSDVSVDDAIAQTADALHGAVGQVVHGVAGDTAQGAHGVGGQVTHVAQGAVATAGTAAHGTGPGSADVAHGAVAQAPGAVAQAGAHAAQAPEAAPEVDYLFGPLSAFAPELAAQSTAAPAAVHTTAAPAAQSAAVPAAAPQPGDVPTALLSAVTQSPPVAAVVSVVAQAAVAAHEQLPDPAAPGGLPYTALRVVGDTLYIAAGVQGDVEAGQIPDTVPQDTLHLVQDVVTGLSGQVPGGQ